MAIILDIGFRVDGTGLSSALQPQLQAISKDIQSAFNAKNLNAGMRQAFNEAIQQAGVLENALRRATTDKGISFATLNTELAKAGTSATGLLTTLAKGGPTFSNSFNVALQSLTQANTQTVALSQKVAQMGQLIANSAKYFATSTIYRELLTTFQGAVSWAKELDSTLTDISIVTGKTGAELDSMYDKIITNSRALRVAADEYAAATQIFYQQGLGDDEVERRTEITVKAAKAAGQSISEMSKELTAIWNTYGMNGDEMERAASAAARLGAESAVLFKDIATAMQSSASAASQMGVSYESLAAIISTVGETTQQSASTVGNAFKTIFSRFQQLEVDLKNGASVELKKLSQQVQALGVDLLDAAGNLRPLEDVILETGDLWDRLSQKQQVALAQLVGGTRQYGQFLALMNNFDRFLDLRDRAMKEDGSALTGQYERALQSVESMAENAREAWMVALKDIFDTDAMRIWYSLVEKSASIIASLSKSVGGLSGLLSLGASYLAGKIVPALYTAKTYMESMGKSGEQLISKSLSQTAATLGNTPQDIQAKQVLEVYQQMARPMAEINRMLSSNNALEQVMGQYLAKRVGDISEIAAGYAKSNESVLSLQKTLSDATAQQAELTTLTAQAAAEFDKMAKAATARPDLGTYTRYGLYGEMLNGSNAGVGAAHSSRGNTAAIAGLTDTHQQAEQIALVLEKLKASGQDTLGVLLNDFRLNRDELDSFIKKLREFASSSETTFSDAARPVEQLVQIMQTEFDKASAAMEKVTNAAATNSRVEEMKSQFTSLAASVQTDISKISEAFTKYDNSQTGLQSKAAALQEVLNHLQTGFTQLGISLPTERLKEIQDGLASIQNGTAGTDVGISALAEGLQFLSENAAQVTVSVGGVAQTMPLLTDSSKQLLGALEKMQQRVQELEAELGKLKKQLEDQQNAMNKFSNSGMQTAQSIGRLISTFGMLASSTANLGKNLGAGTADFTSMAISLGFIIPMVINLGNALAALAVKIGVVEAAAGPIGIAIAAIGALAFTIYNGLKAAGTELDKMKKRAEELSTAADDAAKVVTDLSSAFDNYDSAVKALENCTEGTQEFKDALLEANDAAIQLLDNLPSDVDITGLFNRDSNGLLAINNDKYNNIQKELQQRERSAQIDSFAQNRAVSHAQNAQDIADQQRRAQNDLQGKIRQSLESSPKMGNYGIMDPSGIAKGMVTHIIQNGLDSTVLENYGRMFGEEFAGKIQQFYEAYNQEMEKIAAKVSAQESQDKVVAQVLVDAWLQQLGLVEDISQYPSIISDILAQQLAHSDGSQETMNAFKNDFENKVKNLGTFLNNLTKEADLYRGIMTGDASGMAYDEHNRGALNLGQSLENELRTELGDQADEAFGYLADILGVSLDDLANALEKEARPVVEQLDNVIATLNKTRKGSGDMMRDLMEESGQFASYGDYIDFLEKYQDALGQGGTHLVKLMDTIKEAIAANSDDGIGNIHTYMDALKALFELEPNEASYNSFVKELKSLGIVFAEGSDLTKLYKEEMISYLESIGRATNSIYADFAEMGQITDKVNEKGDSISGEDYQTLVSSNAALGEFFTQMADGTYMLTESAAKFRDLALATQLRPFIEGIDNLRQSIQDTQITADMLNANLKEQSMTPMYDNAVGQQKARSSSLGIATSSFPEVDATAAAQQALSSMKDIAALSEIVSGNEEAARYINDVTEALNKLDPELQKLQISGESAKGVLDQATDALGAFGGMSEKAQKAISDGLIELQGSQMETLLKYQRQVADAQFLDRVNRAGLEFKQVSLEAEQYTNSLLKSANAGEKAALSYDEALRVARDTAVANQKLNRGVQELAKNYESYIGILKRENDAFQKGEAVSSEYLSTMADMRDIFADIFNLSSGEDLSAGFISDLIASGTDLLAVANGDVEAIDALRAAVFEDIVGKIFLDTGGFDAQNEQVQAAYLYLKNWFTMEPAEAKVTLQSDEFLANLNTMIAETGMGVNQIQSLLGSMGVSAKVQTSYVPQEVTVPIETTKEEETGTQTFSMGNITLPKFGVDPETGMTVYEGEETHPGGTKTVKTTRRFTVQDGVYTGTGYVPTYSVESISGAYSSGGNIDTGGVQKIPTKVNRSSTPAGGGGVKSSGGSGKKSGGSGKKSGGSGGSGKKSGGSGKKGGSGGSGGSGSVKELKKKSVPKAPEKPEPLEARYANIQAKLDSNTRSIERLDQAQNSAWGRAKLNNLAAYNLALQRQGQLYQVLLGEAQDYLRIDQAQAMKRLEAINAGLAEAQRVNMLFNEDGFIANREELTAAINAFLSPQQSKVFAAEEAVRNLTLQYNEAVDAGNASLVESLEEQLETADEVLSTEEDALSVQQAVVDKVTEAMDKSDETAEKVKSTVKEIVDLINDWMENKVAEIQEKLQFRIAIKETDIRIIESMIDHLGDLGTVTRKTFGALQATFSKTRDEISATVEAMNRGLQIIQHINPDSGLNFEQYFGKEAWQAYLAGNGAIPEQVISTLEDMRDNLLDYRDTLYNTSQKMFDEYLHLLEHYQTEFSRIADKISANSNELQFYQELLSYTGRRFTPAGRATERNLLTAQLDSAKTEVTRAKAEMDFLLEQREATQANLDKFLEKYGDPATFDEKTAHVYNNLLQHRNELWDAWNSAQQTFYSDLSDMLSTAQEILTETAQDIADTFAEGLNGLFSSLDEISEMYNHQKAIDTFFLDEDKKAFELQYLLDDIQHHLEDITDPERLAAYDSLIADILDKMREGEELTQSELEILQAQYDLQKMLDELEDARKQKNSVRLTRDASGNWNYQYYNDTEDTFDLEQRIKKQEEDIKQMHRNIVQDAEDSWIEIEVAVRNFIANIDWALYESNEQYREYVDARIAKYQLQSERYANLIKRHTEEAGLVYADTTLGIVTNTDSMDEAQARYTDNYRGYADALKENAREWQESIQEQCEAVGMNYDTLEEDMNLRTQEMMDENDALDTEIQNLAIDASSSMNEMSAAIDAWAYDFIDQMAAVEAQIWQLIDALNALRVAQGLDAIDDYSYAAATELKGAGYDLRKVGTAIGSILSRREQKQGETGLGGDNAALASLIWTASDYNTDETSRNQARSIFSSVTKQGDIFSKAGIAKLRQDYAWMDANMGKLTGFDTGGYTGTWGTGGRIGILHEKELVLSKEDTANILGAVNIVRQAVASGIKFVSGALAAQVSNNAAQVGTGAFTTTPVAQSVMIDAQFPNVQVADEIQQALNGLINQAVQYAAGR